MSQPEPKSARRYGIVPHPADLRLLLLPGAEGWTLPFVTLEEHFYPMAGPINQAFASQFGLTATTLRWVYRHPAPFEATPDRVYALENQSPAWQPPAGARWVSSPELSDLPLAVPGHRAVLERWFAEEGGRQAPALRAPWAGPGWHGEACAWISQQLAAHGITVTGPPEQVKVWSLSCLLRVPTDQGDFWFKASPAGFAAEVGITAALTGEYPTLFPPLLAADIDRRWMLMRNFDGTLLDRVPAIERWEEALQAYARMQIDLIGREPFILRTGCGDRRIPVMTAQFDEMLRDAATLQGEGGMEPGELEQIRSMADELKALAAELEGAGIPYTLEHGDLHPRNMSASGASVMLFDWSDGCLSHPFFSLVMFLWSMEGAAVGNTPAVKRRLRDAYLAAWTGFAPPGRLEAIYAMAERLAPIHYALSHYRYILPHVEAREEWTWAPPYFLRRLLKA